MGTLNEIMALSEITTTLKMEAACFSKMLVGFFFFRLHGITSQGRIIILVKFICVFFGYDIV
jgi:hypothetical protein